MKFYSCKVWSCDPETGIRVSQVAKGCIPAPEVLLLKRIHGTNVTDVKELEKPLDPTWDERTDRQWRDYLQTYGYGRRVIAREFDTSGRLPQTIDQVRAPARRRPADDADDFGAAA